MKETSAKRFECSSDNKIVPFLRVVVDEGEESLKREQNRVCELQQQLEQERAVSLHKEKEEEERRGVRTNMNENKSCIQGSFYVAF